MNLRGEKIKKALIKEISDIIQKEVRDPRLPDVVSIVDIDLSADYKHAKVYVSVFGSDEEKAKAIEALEEATKNIRKEVGKRIRLRFTPEIAFFLDDSLERGLRISQILDRISKGEL